MQNLVNKEVDVWVRPWNRTKFDNIYEKDDRFFALLIKGVLSWLNENLVMYDKPIRHFILNTGSAYMYLENNGYEYTWCETSGEDLLYMETPRCIVSVGNFSIPTEELTAPFIRGVYERVSTAEKTKGQTMAYNAEMRRLPIEVSMNLKYVFSNFNEAIIFVQELFEKILFQRYFQIIYLGQIINCSIEINGDTNINLSELDLSSKDNNYRTMEFEITVASNLPLINEKTESLCTDIISGHLGDISNSKDNSILGTYNKIDPIQMS